MSAKKLNIPPEKFDDEAPPNPAPLKTNYKDPAKRFALAERVIWSKLPRWKQCVIARCKLSASKYTPYDKQTDTGISGGSREDRIMDEYARDIVKLAESDDKLDKAESLAPVPSFDLSNEMPDAKGLTNK